MTFSTVINKLVAAQRVEVAEIKEDSTCSRGAAHTHMHCPVSVELRLLHGGEP